MNLEGKRVAVLGGTRISCEIVRAAHSLGMHVTVLDYNPPKKSPAKLIADEHALVSVAKPRAVADYAHIHGIDGLICGYADSILGWYAEACEMAGLPCYGSKEQFEVFSDKVLWKARCLEHGVPTARSYDAAALYRHPEDAPYPLMLKPADSSGGCGVYAVQDPSEYRRLYDASAQYSKKGTVLAEDYLEGAEVTVFWVFAEGEYHVNLIGNRHVKHNQEDTIPLPAGYTFPASITPRYMAEVAPRVRRMLAAEGVRDGMMFMQCVVRNGLPFVYDVGYRLTGSLEHLITAATAGHSTVDMLLHYAVTGRMADGVDLADSAKKSLHAPCYNISCLMRPGTIDRFEGLNALDGDPTVVAYAKAHVEGETLPPEAKGQLRQIALRILGKVDSVDELGPTMLRLQNKVRIVSPEGKDLRLLGLEPSDFEGVLLR